MNSFWPTTLSSPHIDLELPVSEALVQLNALGEVIEKQDDNEHSFTVEGPEFSVAFYEQNGIIIGVWYNDPRGRLWSKGRAKKVNLYLQRYGALNGWEMRLDNGVMRYYFNDVADLTMIYGIHDDVILFNLNQSE